MFACTISNYRANSPPYCLNVTIFRPNLYISENFRMCPIPISKSFFYYKISGKSTTQPYVTFQVFASFGRVYQPYSIISTKVDKTQLYNRAKIKCEGDRTEKKVNARQYSCRRSFAFEFLQISEKKNFAEIPELRPMSHLRFYCAILSHECATLSRDNVSDAATVE